MNAGTSIAWLLAGVALVFSCRTTDAAEEFDVSGYFRERDLLRQVTGILANYTIEEAKLSVSLLEKELRLDPRNHLYSGLHTVLQSIFRAEHQLLESLRAREKNEREARRLEALAKDSMKPSPLTGDVDRITAAQYRKRARELRTEAAEALENAQERLHSTLATGIEFASFCHERGNGSVAGELHQLIRTKAARIGNSKIIKSQPLGIWDKPKITASIAVEDSLHDALSASSTGIVENRHLTAHEIATAALRESPSNPWLTHVEETSGRVASRSKELSSLAQLAMEAKDYGTAAEQAEKAHRVSVDNDEAKRILEKATRLLSEKGEKLADAVRFETNEQLGEALAIFDLYGKIDDFRRVAWKIAIQAEELGDFPKANKHYQLSGDQEGFLRTLAPAKAAEAARERPDPTL